MSTYYGDGYDDEPRRYRNVQTRPRERGEPDYVREETYIERGKGPMPRDMMPYRGREDSVEEISRDFPPPGSRTDYRRSSARSEYDDYGIRMTTTTTIDPRTTALLLLVAPLLAMLLAGVESRVIAEAVETVITTPTTPTLLHHAKKRSVASQASKSCWVVSV
jgi:hypothetical protein